MFGNESWEVASVARNSDGDKTVTGTRVIRRCAFAPSGSVEDTDRQQQVVRSASLYLPAGESVAPTDRLKRLLDNTVWQVDGDVDTWSSPYRRWLPGSEVRLKRVTG